MKYSDLEIWKLSDELVKAIHDMTLEDLPKHEMFETGSQIRRSIKSVKSNIVEGFGRRYYKKDFLHFLVIANASCDETLDHLDTLSRTNSLKNKTKYFLLKTKTETLGKKLSLFITAVKKAHKTL